MRKYLSLKKFSLKKYCGRTKTCRIEEGAASLDAPCADASFPKGASDDGPQSASSADLFS
jgi:hypothetical protein